MSTPGTSDVKMTGEGALYLVKGKRRPRVSVLPRSAALTQHDAYIFVSPPKIFVWTGSSVSQMVSMCCCI